jgi:hypothetical protein
MSEGPESRLTLRQADQARADFAIAETELEAIHARLPTRTGLARATLIGMLGGASLVIAWIEVF